MESSFKELDYIIRFKKNSNIMILLVGFELLIFDVLNLITDIGFIITGTVIITCYLLVFIRVFIFRFKLYLKYKELMEIKNNSIEKIIFFTELKEIKKILIKDSYH